MFNSIPKLLKVFVRWQLRKQGKPKDHEIMDLEGNIAAAIGLALHLHFKKNHMTMKAALLQSNEFQGNILLGVQKSIRQIHFF